MDNHNNTAKTILSVVAAIAVLLLVFFLQKTIPKLPFEPPWFYCKRTTEIPFLGTYEEYNRCMSENTGPKTK
ncbi:hypothetical protein IKG73_02020 [Candidatus Saccharibacteria bacterium]|nr:hypothetical protein [Candidatus Saccharibacteria bacterium]